MSFYRVQIDTPQKDGSIATEAQFVEVPDGTEPPEGGVLAPDDFGETPYHFDEQAGTFTLDAASLDAELHNQIDQAVGAIRRVFLTDITAQDLVYLRKEQQARQFLAGGPGPFGALESEVAETGYPIEQVAAWIVQRADEAAAIGDPLEAKRGAAKRAVTAATTAADKRAAAAVDWQAFLAVAPGGAS